MGLVRVAQSRGSLNVPAPGLRACAPLMRIDAAILLIATARGGPSLTIDSEPPPPLAQHSQGIKATLHRVVEGNAIHYSIDQWHPLHLRKDQSQQPLCLEEVWSII